ncbi:hypothetical protein OSB04_019984 [Centaurea solstitialis]|uniref:Uncharacterized protein n=1 Tax=Centaurea solstitialis TaxID=347529 RepID=A0AA38T4S9_9ASTR|nr:hypothetical protein OSB04_019984 [Centaurea solstitialis]
MAMPQEDQVFEIALYSLNYPTRRTLPYPTPCLHLMSNMERNRNWRIGKGQVAKAILNGVGRGVGTGLVPTIGIELVWLRMKADVAAEVAAGMGDMSGTVMQLRLVTQNFTKTLPEKALHYVKELQSERERERERERRWANESNSLEMTQPPPPSINCTGVHMCTGPPLYKCFVKVHQSSSGCTDVSLECTPRSAQICIFIEESSNVNTILVVNMRTNFSHSSGDLDYVRILNGVLSDDIRVIGWCPALINFSASPIFKPVNIQIVPTLAFSKKLKIQQLDIKNTFLYGHLQENVFMHQPPESKDI